MGCNYRQWVGSRGLSNHSPIYLEISGGVNKTKAPYKFNVTWLKYVDYIKLVTDYSKSHPPTIGGNIAETFAHNLRNLKKLSKRWAHNKRLMDDQTLRSVEAEIDSMEDEHGRAYISPEHKERLTMFGLKCGCKLEFN